MKANEPFGAVGVINGECTNWKGYGSQGPSTSGVEDRVCQTPISGTHSSPGICGMVLSSSKANRFLPCYTSIKIIEQWGKQTTHRKHLGSEPIKPPLQQPPDL